LIVFNKFYASLTLLLFTVELVIALFVHDQLIRPYVGDGLVVMLLYCFIKSFFTIAPLKTAVGVLVFAYCIEFAQFFHLSSLLGLEHNNWAKVIIGNTFGIEDLIVYALGLLLTLLIEKVMGNKL